MATTVVGYYQERKLKAIFKWKKYFLHIVISLLGPSVETSQKTELTMCTFDNVYEFGNVYLFMSANSSLVLQNHKTIFAVLNSTACSVMSNSLWPHRLQSTGLLCSWNFLGTNTEVGCHFLFQGIFLTQGSNPHLLCLLHCRQILYHGAI